MNEDLKELLEKIKAEQKVAWDARDFDRVSFFINIERTLRELSLVAISVNNLMNRTGSDDALEALSEALQACGLLLES